MVDLLVLAYLGAMLLLLVLPWGETLGVTHGFRSVIRRSWNHVEDDFITRTLSVGGNTATAAMIMANDGEAAFAIDRAITTDIAIVGILLEPILPASTYDIDDVLTDGIQVRLLRQHPAGSYEVAMIHEKTSGFTALKEGHVIQVGSEAGKVRHQVYAEDTAATEMATDVVGVSAETATVSTTADHIIAVRWGRG